MVMMPQATSGTISAAVFTFSSNLLFKHEIRFWDAAIPFTTDHTRVRQANPEVFRCFYCVCIWLFAVVPPDDIFVPRDVESVWHFVCLFVLYT